MLRDKLTISKGMLLIVEHEGQLRRAVVTDTFWLSVAPGDEFHEPDAGTFEVSLGFGVKALPHDVAALGDSVSLLPRQVRAVVTLADRSQLAGTHYDWLAHCRAALEYAETQFSKGPWDQVLGKPWNWCAEAWLGGHDVPCTIDNIQG